MTQQVTVTMKHVRGANLCSRGARAWFAKYRLNWPMFLASGLPVEAIEQTGDALGLRVARIAREEAARRG